MLHELVLLLPLHAQTDKSCFGHGNRRSKRSANVKPTSAPWYTRLCLVCVCVHARGALACRGVCLAARARCKMESPSAVSASQPAPAPWRTRDLGTR